MQQSRDRDKVLSMLAGDTQRIWLYAERGQAMPQHFPAEVRHAYQVLLMAGHSSRTI